MNKQMYLIKLDIDPHIDPSEAHEIGKYALSDILDAEILDLDSIIEFLKDLANDEPRRVAYDIKLKVKQILDTLGVSNDAV